MVSGNTKRTTDLKINEQAVEQVSSYKYLGVHLEEDGTQETEINTRIENVSKLLYYSIKNTFLGKKEVPTLIFGCESWLLTQNMKSNIQSMEMKFLRKIMGVTRMDKIRNEAIREELKVEPELKIIEESQPRWFGHLCRMKADRPVRKVWEAERHEKRLRDRPTKSWDETISKLLMSRGITRKEAKNKLKCRKFVYGAQAPHGQ